MRRVDTIAAAGLLLGLAAAVPAVRAESAATAAERAPAAAPSPRRTNSIIAILLLDGTQIERLNRAYDAFARTRLEQEAAVAARQDALKAAQAPATFDERKAARILGEIKNAEQKIAEAFLRARAEALAALTPEQRAALEQARAQNRVVTDDKYRRLLLVDLEGMWHTPLDPDTARALVARGRERNYYGDAYLGYFGHGYGYGYGYGFGWHHRFPRVRPGGGLGARIPRPGPDRLPGSLRPRANTPPRSGRR